MITITALTNHYIRLQDFRPASEKIYRASARAFVRHFGNIDPASKTRDQIIAWRKELLEAGLAKRSWNTYSSHLRTVVQFGIEQGYLQLLINPFKGTTVIPSTKRKKTVAHHAIDAARNWLLMLEQDERIQMKRAQITPAWFWLTVFETFHLTGIRLKALLSVRLKDVDLRQSLLMIRGETEKTHRDHMVPIPEDLYPLLVQLVEAAHATGFYPNDQLFNVNRFSTYYHRDEMDTN